MDAKPAYAQARALGLLATHPALPGRAVLCERARHAGADAELGQWALCHACAP